MKRLALLTSMARATGLKDVLPHGVEGLLPDNAFCAFAPGLELDIGHCFDPETQGLVEQIVLQFGFVLPGEGHFEDHDLPSIQLRHHPGRCVWRLRMLPDAMSGLYSEEQVTFAQRHGYELRQGDEATILGAADFLRLFKAMLDRIRRRNEWYPTRPASD